MACSPAVRRGESPDTRLAKARENDAAFQTVFGALKGIHYVTSAQVDECVQGFVDGAVPEYFLWGCRDMPKAFEWYTSRSSAPFHAAQYENFRRLIAAVLLAGAPRALGGGGTGAEGIYGSDFGESASEGQGDKERGRHHGEGRMNAGESAKEGQGYPNRADGGNVFQCVALKSPHHSVQLTTIAEVFGDIDRGRERNRQRAVFVWLHRSPAAVVGSTCSMNATVNSCMTSLFEETPSALGRRTLSCLARSMDIAVRQRRELEEAAGPSETSPLFIDVFHEDLRKDPVAVVERVYKEAGLEVSAAFRSALVKRAAEERAKAAARKQQAQHQRGRHRYSLAEYGLSQSDVDAAFSVYNEFVREIKSRSAGRS